MPIPLIPLAIALGGATIGAAGSAVNRNNYKNAKNSWFDYAEGFANTQRNLSYLDTPGGKSLLKIADRNAAKTQDAINNQMMAGGATMENALAARQANNENRDKMNMQVVQADQKRKDAWDNQLLNLKGQRADFNANMYLQAAQDWNQWGGQMAQAGMGLLNAGLLGGAGSIASAASAASAAASPVEVAPVPQYQYGPLAPAADKNRLGGLVTV